MKKTFPYYKDDEDECEYGYESEPAYCEKDLDECYADGVNDGMIQAYSNAGWEILKIPLKNKNEHLLIQAWIRSDIDPLVDGKIVHFLYKKMDVFCVEKKETAAYVRLKFG
jgi:hypothetical protein